MCELMKTLRIGVLLGYGRGTCISLLQAWGSHRPLHSMSKFELVS